MKREELGFFSFHFSTRESKISPKGFRIEWLSPSHFVAKKGSKFPVVYGTFRPMWEVESSPVIIRSSIVAKDDQQQSVLNQ